MLLGLVVGSVGGCGEEVEEVGSANLELDVRIWNWTCES